MPSTYQYLKRLADAGQYVTLACDLDPTRPRRYTCTIESSPRPRNTPPQGTFVVARTLRSAVQAAYVSWKGKK